MEQLQIAQQELDEMEKKNRKLEKQLAILVKKNAEMR